MTPQRSLAHSTSPFARLRAEHQRALARLRTFERALITAPQPGRDDRPFRSMARYLAGAFDVHMAVEEGVVFPALLEHLPELALTLEPLREDHAEIRDMTRSLTALLDPPVTADREEQLRVLGRDLTDLLRLHVHHEERAVLSWGERGLSAAVLGELERRIARVLATAEPPNRLRP